MNRPVACQLTDAELRGRRDSLLATMRAMARSARRNADELTMPFESDASLGPVLDFVAAERTCCPFLTVRLETGPRDQPTRLTIAGPPGTRSFLERSD